MLVAHGHLVSFFSVQKQKWIKHFDFDQQVVGVFRQKDENDEYDLCVLLSDGTIKVINERNKEDPETEDLTLDTSIEFKLEGKLLAQDMDKEGNTWTFILTSVPNEAKESGADFTLNILHLRQLYKITDETYPWLSGNTPFYIHIKLV
jgi:hypothetical protein